MARTALVLPVAFIVGLGVATRDVSTSTDSTGKGISEFQIPDLGFEIRDIKDYGVVLKLSFTFPSATTVIALASKRRLATRCRSAAVIFSIFSLTLSG